MGGHYVQPLHLVDTSPWAEEGVQGLRMGRRPVVAPLVGAMVPRAAVFPDREMIVVVQMLSDQERVAVPEMLADPETSAVVELVVLVNWARKVFVVADFA